MLAPERSWQGCEMIVTLVVTWFAYGSDHERRTVMPDLTACQNRAAEVMAEILSDPRYDNATAISVGCVIDRDGDSL